LIGKSEFDAAFIDPGSFTHSIPVLHCSAGFVGKIIG